MSTMTTNVDEDTLVSIRTAEIRVLDAKIAAMQEARAVLANDLAFRLPLGKTVVGNGSVTVSENNTYDGAAFLASLRPGQQQRVTSRTLDRAKARAAYPALWESVKETKGRKLSVSK